MANQEHISILIQGSKAWNKWRSENPSIVPDLSSISIEYSDLQGGDFREADLTNSDLSQANLYGSSLCACNLYESYISEEDSSRYMMSTHNLNPLFGEEIFCQSSSQIRRNIFLPVDLISQHEIVYPLESSRENIKSSEQDEKGSDKILENNDIRHACEHEYVLDNEAYRVIEDYGSLHESTLSGSCQSIENESLLPDEKIDNLILQDLDLQYLDLTNADLRNSSFSGSNLAYSVFDGADLKECILSEVNNFSYSILYQSHTRTQSHEKANNVIEVIIEEHCFWPFEMPELLAFHGFCPEQVEFFDLQADDFDIEKLNFSETILKSTRFTDTELNYADFSGATLNEVVFIHAEMQDVSFENAFLHKVIFVGVDLSFSDFSGAFLDEVYFIDSQLLDSLLNKSNLRSVSFKDCDLSNANFQRANLLQCCLVNCKVQCTNVCYTVFHACQVKKIDMHDLYYNESTKFLFCDLSGLRLMYMDLQEIDFNGSNLENVSFRESNLSYASLRGANLFGVDLCQVKIYETIFSDAILKKVRFKWVNVDNAFFSKTVFIDVDMSLENQSKIVRKGGIIR